MNTNRMNAKPNTEVDDAFSIASCALCIRAEHGETIRRPLVRMVLDLALQASGIRLTDGEIAFVRYNLYRAHRCWVTD